MYWGAVILNPEGSAAREQISEEILEKGRYDNALALYRFPQYSNICEVGLLYVVGFTSANTVSAFPRQWKRLREAKLYKQGFRLTCPDWSIDKGPGREETKFHHCTAYIKWIAGTYGSDACGIGETVPDGAVKEANVRVLPYDSVSQIFHEYQAHSIVNEDEKRLIACRETFRKAFAAQTEVRLLGAKGSFQTCDICNVANELLRKTSFSREQRETIMTYKRLHIDQQKAERDNFEVQKLKALQNVGNDGIPNTGLLYSDGMTVFTNNTPTGGKSRKVKGVGTHQFTNRIVGVYAVCGPVNEKFLYNLDDFVAGGANSMVEIMRQGIIYVSV